MESFLREVDEQVKEGVENAKQSLKKTKRSNNYLESIVTKSLQENFQNTIYPIILENISISEDGEFRNTKSAGSTTDIQDNSMLSENFT